MDPLLAMEIYVFTFQQNSTELGRILPDKDGDYIFIMATRAKCEIWFKSFTMRFGFKIFTVKK